MEGLLEKEVNVSSPSRTLTQTRIPLEERNYKITDEKIICKSIHWEEDILRKLCKFADDHRISYESILFGCFNIMLLKLTGCADNMTVYVKASPRTDAYRPLQISIKGDTRLIDALITINQAYHEGKNSTFENTGESSAELKEHIGYSFIEGPFDTLSETEETNSFKLGLICNQSQNSLALTFYHKESCFPMGTNELMQNRFLEAAKNIIAGPQTAISEFNILPESERLEIHKFSQGTISEIDSRCFHQVFEEQAERYPDNIAVSYGSNRLTYKELNERANKLARFINEKVESKESLIGICMERSIEFLISIIGIFKAGCAYVPLDPDTLNPGRAGFPQKRLSFMLEDTKVKILISKKNIKDKIPQTDSKIICLDSDWDSLLSHYGKENLEKEISNRNLAYGIYTSGSTGKPKVVLVEHRSVMNLFKGLDDQAFKKLRNEENIRFSLNAPLGFDASVQQLTGLLKGYCISIIPEDVRNSGKVLLKYLKESKIQLFDCTPSQLQLLIDDGLLENDATELTAILVGGEPISQEMWNKLINTGCDIDFYNVYGPTECTVDATLFPIKKEYSEVPLIGRPIVNNNIFILDEKMGMVPIGVDGEMYISGNGLSRGYLNREELTNEKYLPNPFDATGETKIYRTGDLASFQIDGNIKYKSRIDNQIKIRSHRIELGEVQAVLKQHPSVKDAIAVLNTESSVKKIVVYIILKQSVQPKIDEYIQFLSEYLPIYMLPNNYVFVGSWPLTPNGKVDVRSLPSISKERPNLKTPYVKPESAIEKEIAGIYEDVLNIGHVGIDDNFVSLGGDSLRAITVLTKVYTNYNIDIDFSVFFLQPTVRNLVKLIKGN